MSDQDRFDDRIRRVLGDIGSSASERVTAPPAAGIRRRAQRRRQVVVAGVITAVVVFGGSGVLLADVLDSSSIGPVAPPTSSPSRTEPEATETPSAPPPSNPPTVPNGLPTSPSALPPPPPPTVGPWPAGDPATVIPAGLKLPHEDEINGGGEEFTDWVTTDELDTRWPWAPCGVDVYDGDELRTDRRQVAMSGVEANARTSSRCGGTRWKRLAS